MERFVERRTINAALATGIYEALTLFCQVAHTVPVSCNLFVET